MSSADEQHTSEVGGLQGVFQNLGTSLGTALVGSVLIASLATSFAGSHRTDADWGGNRAGEFHTGHSR